MVLTLSRSKKDMIFAMLIYEEDEKRNTHLGWIEQEQWTKAGVVEVQFLFGFECVCFIWEGSTCYVVTRVFWYWQYLYPRAKCQ